MRVADVAEDGLHGPESSTVLIATLIGVDLALHLFKIFFWFALRTPKDKCHLAKVSALWMLKTLCSKWTM